MATTDQKTCVRCTRLERPALKPLSAFPANPKTRDGKSSWCQQCTTEYRREWLADKTPEQLAAWKQDQREKRKQCERDRRWAALAAAAATAPVPA